MRILILEKDLMWSSRLSKSIQAVGHTPVVSSAMPTDRPDCDAVILNLGSASMPPDSVVPIFKGWRIAIAAHAGHKEKDLHKLGAEVGVDVLATNSELTWKTQQIVDKLEKIVENFEKPGNTS